jgi:hypothetical protein
MLRTLTASSTHPECILSYQHALHRLLVLHPGRPSATSPFASLAAWGRPPDGQPAADSTAQGTEGAVQGAGQAPGSGAVQSGGRNGRQRLGHTGVGKGAAGGHPASGVSVGTAAAGVTVSGAGSSGMEDTSGGGAKDAVTTKGSQQGRGPLLASKWQPPEPDQKSKRARPRMASASTQTAGLATVEAGDQNSTAGGTAVTDAAASKAPKRANNSKARAKAAAVAKGQEAALQGVAQAGYEGSAVPLPPPMPPSRVTMEEALTQVCADGILSS